MTSSFYYLPLFFLSLTVAEMHTLWQLAPRPPVASVGGAWLIDADAAGSARLIGWEEAAQDSPDATLFTRVRRSRRWCGDVMCLTVWRRRTGSQHLSGKSALWLPFTPRSSVSLMVLMRVKNARFWSITDAMTRDYSPWHWDLQRVFFSSFHMSQGDFNSKLLYLCEGIRLNCRQANGRGEAELSRRCFSSSSSSTRCKWPSRRRPS